MAKDSTKTLSDKATRQLSELARAEDNAPKDPRVDRGRDTFNLPEVHFIKVPDDGIPARDDTELGSEECTLYKAPPTSFGSTTRELEKQANGAGNDITYRIYNLSLDSIESETEYLPVFRTKGGVWFTLPQFALRRFCLAEDHPGRGIVFDAYKGEWDPADHEWVFSGTTVKCIDWWYSAGGPYPDAGATGLMIARPSDDYGTIYEVVTMDCDSPGSCYSS